MGYSSTSSTHTAFYMSLFDSYHQLTYHVVPGPQGPSYFVPLVLLPVALLIPRTVLSRWQNALVFTPVMAICTIHSWVQMGGVDVISVNALLWCLYFLVLKDVHDKFGRITVDRRPDDHDTRSRQPEGSDDSGWSGSRKRSGVFTQYYPPTFNDRLPWVGALLSSIRMNDWITGDPSHDQRQPPEPAFKDRAALAKVALKCFVRGYLVLDITRTYISYDPYFTDPTISITSPASFSHLDLIPPKILRCIVIGLQGWAVLSQFTYVLCLLPISLNAVGWLPDEWSPHTWAPLYGDAKVVLLNGVRGFWSQYWHQSMRISTTAPGYAIADTIGLRRGGVIRYVIITTVAFFLSGIVHMGLVPPDPLYASTDANSIRLMVAGFFWLQPMAILVEVLVARVLVSIVSPTSLQSTNVQRCRYLANALLVFVWGVICLPLLGDVARQLGYWRVWPIPVSLCRGLSGKGFVVMFS